MSRVVTAAGVIGPIPPLGDPLQQALNRLPGRGLQGLRGRIPAIVAAAA